MWIHCKPLKCQTRIRKWAMLRREQPTSPSHNCPILIMTTGISVWECLLSRDHKYLLQHPLQPVPLLIPAPPSPSLPPPSPLSCTVNALWLGNTLLSVDSELYLNVASYWLQTRPGVVHCARHLGVLPGHALNSVYWRPLSGGGGGGGGITQSKISYSRNIEAISDLRWM